ncbi:MAG: CDP-alcohol phosphatidyltransferase family protein [Ornithinimicrobium sp.]
MATGTCPHRHRECADVERERWNTAPNLITLIRTAVAVFLALAAASHESLTLVLVATAVYWVGDMADGAVARWLHRETRTGAVLDIACDRACAGAIYVGLVWLMPQMWLPIAVYLLSFGVLDLMLSLAFLRFPLASPNYFYLADPTIYRYNWSRVAKGLNSALFLAVVVLVGVPAVALALACLLLLLKAVSLHLLAALPLPAPDQDCARALRSERPAASP